jgi:DNA polymerase-3 subunit epsilon
MRSSEKNGQASEVIREIVLDVETTGLDPRDHRITEIGCVELVNYLPTGRVFQTYINPQRPMSEGASRISGLTDSFLADFPIFDAIVDDFLNFIGDDAPLVIHNASFDMGFINAELRRLKRSEIPASRAIDTLEIARRQFPGAQNSLDALCRRFKIDISHRTKHGALLDSELLACVYLELKGGRQMGFSLASDTTQGTNESISIGPRGYQRQPRFSILSLEEKAAHDILISQLKNALWLNS